LSQCHDPKLVARAIEAAHVRFGRPEALPEPTLASLGIADLNPANILWDGDTCRLVDFEDGGLTAPAFELADHLEHIESTTRNI
jgi:Ser/Thr protein kinase RdoA (MazF antagonist)